jgi:hypothetical protein
MCRGKAVIPNDTSLAGSGRRRGSRPGSKKRKRMRMGFAPAPPDRSSAARLGSAERLRRTAEISGGRRTTPPPPFSPAPRRSPRPLSPPPFFPSSGTRAGGDRRGGCPVDERCSSDERRGCLLLRRGNWGRGRGGWGKRGREENRRRRGFASRPRTLDCAAQPPSFLLLQPSGA